MKTKLHSSFLLAALALSPASAHANLLANPGFEDGSGSYVADWSCWKNASQETNYAHTGTHALKLFGNWSGPYNSSSAWQTFSASPGDTWTLSGYGLTPSADALAGENYALLKIVWWSGPNGTGDPLQPLPGPGALFGDAPGIESAKLTNGTPTDAWQFLSASGRAPPGTRSVQLFGGLFLQPSDAAGSAWFDDVSASAEVFVTTMPASGLLNDAATLNGSVNPSGVEATAWFEWRSALGCRTNTPPVTVGSGTNSVLVTNSLTGLTPGGVYHYRLVASNSLAMTWGADRSFWTPALSPNGPNPMTNECHVPFIDLGASVTGSPLAIAAGDSHSLALPADGSVVGWGNNDKGQTNVPPSATYGVVAIAAGGSHSLALRADGSVVGWGYNNSGQTTIPAGATNGVVAIAAGYRHSLALRADGSVVGWGNNYAGLTNVPPSATYGVVAIAAGSAHSLALRADGSVVGWGWNDYGQTDIPAGATNGVVAIAAGSSHCLALKADGSVVGWGYNGNGQTDVPPSATNGVVAIAAGESHSLALKADGSVVGWGNNDSTLLAGLNLLNLPVAVSGTVDVDVPGTYVLTYSVTNALGAVGTATRTVVVVVPPEVTTLPASDVLAVGTSASATLNGAVKPGSLPAASWFEWGSAAHAYGSNTPAAILVATNAALPVSSALSGLTPGRVYHYRLVASNSLAMTWGADQSFWTPALSLNGPNPMTNECHVPFVDLGASVTASPLAIAAGYYHSLALRADGSVVGWGWNNNGQTIIPAGATTGVVAIAAGGSHSLALRADGSVVGWGNNDSGQTTIPAGATNGVAIAAGGSHSLALRADGSVVGWGWNDYGQTTIPAGATNGVVAIAAGAAHSLALRADGSVVGWGYNGNGQTNIPAGATNVVAIAAGGSHSLALRADGSVVGWGDNYFGQTTIPAGATNGVVAIAAGGGHSLALRDDGSVVGWGANSSGQTNIPAGATNGVVAIAAGFYHSLALRADGSVVGWGRNDYGQATFLAGLNLLNLPPAASGTVDTNSPGNYLLTYSVTNALGAVGTATRTVVVADTLPPVLTPLGDHPLLHEAGLPFTDPGATATDLCAGDLSANIISNLTVNPNVPGTYTNTYTVSDASGNPAQTNRTVIVRDTTPPLITLLGANPLLHEAGSPFTDPGATASDLCAGDLSANIISNLTVNPNVPGTYTNTYTVSDASGNPAQTSRTVIVRDTTPPAIMTCATNRTLAAGANCQAALPDLTGEIVAADVVTPPGSLVITQSPPPGTMLGPGPTGVTFTIRDAANNATNCEATILVADQTPPVLTCPTNVVVTALPGQCEAVATFSATAADNCDPSPTVTSVPPSGSTFPVGRTPVTCTAWDASGNTNTCTFTVSVYSSSELGPAGETWMPRESNRNWRSVASSADGTRLVAAVQSGQLYTSTDAGTNWTATTAPSTNWSCVASSADGTKLVGVVNSGPIYTSTDSGTNWTARASNRSWWSVASSADGSGLIAGVSSQIYTSTDAGTNWTPHMSPGVIRGVASSADGSKLVAVAGPGRIYTSTDAGTTWTTRMTDASRNWYAVASSADGTRLAAVVNGGQIYTSTDGGTNWTATSAPSTNWSCVASSADGARLVAVVNGGQIYTSVDAGTNWPAQETARNWASVTSSADGSKLVAVENGGQIYTSVGSPVPLTNPPAILGATNQMVQAGTVVTYNVTATNVCQPSVPVTCTPPSGSTFPVGTNTVTCEAVDAFGVTSIATFTVTVLLPAQPVFGGYCVPAPGQFRLQGTGTAGLTYTLQTSTNLVDWVDHANLLANPSGLIECLEDMDPGAPTCFYRLKWP